MIISSAAGLVGIYGYSAYCPTKFAVRGLAESLRQEFKPLGISVSIVYPPDTDTPQLTQENLTKPVETRLINGTIKVMSADEVAACIVKGMDNNKFHISPGFITKLLRFFHSSLFGLINHDLDKKNATAQASRSKVDEK